MTSRQRKPEPLLWVLFQQLIRRRFPLGPADFEALRTALRAGFGYESSNALRKLCCLLWAKSQKECNVITILFDQLPLAEWSLLQNEQPVFPLPANEDKSVTPSPALEQTPKQHEVILTELQPSLLPISLDGVQVPDRSFILTSLFPLTHFEIVQAWRRLRLPVREGPKTELNIEETINHRLRRGVVSPIVLSPRRQNKVKLLLLIDRKGSMTPFHNFIDEVCSAIVQSARLGQVTIFYFQDSLTEGVDMSLVTPISTKIFPVLDSILQDIKPLDSGYIFADNELLEPRLLSDVLTEYANKAAVTIISDAGAARGQYDQLRLLNTVAFLKALRKNSATVVWLNPVPHQRWKGSTAAQLARHIPMFTLNKSGIHQAVSVLQGHVYSLKAPV